MKRLILSILLLWPAAAWGFDSAGELLDRLAADRFAPDALEAVYEFEYPSGGGDPAGGIAEKTLVRETVFYRAPDRIRLNLTWPDREEVFLAANLSTLVMVGDQATDTPWPQPFLFYRLLLEPDPHKVRGLFESFDVDLATFSPGQDAPVFIVGAGPGETSRPQAWFDRETLDLVRLILPARGGRTGYDLTASDYHRHEPGVPWPDRLEVRTTAGPALTLVLKSLRVNPTIEQEDFDLEEIKKTVAPPPEQGAGSDLWPELNALKKQLEWFQKKLE
ncbi:MAG: hypothetical protein AB1896_13175 [Thermodesulfobacteriota bacterium]